MIKLFGARGQGKTLKWNEFLDSPVYICDKCKISIRIEYLEPYQVNYCPQCSEKGMRCTTMRKEYLGVQRISETVSD